MTSGRKHYEIEVRLKDGSVTKTIMAAIDHKSARQRAINKYAEYCGVVLSTKEVKYG